MIDLSEDQILTVKAVLEKHVPGKQIVVFGSRVLERAKKYSDLDLCIMGDRQLDLSTMADLREAFSESDLPIKVDIVDWAATEPYFQKIIAAQSVPLE